MLQAVTRVVSVVALVSLALPARAGQSNDEFNVRVTVVASQVRRETFGYSVLLAAYVDGTLAELKCSQCDQPAPGRYSGRWDKDRIRIREQESFGNQKVKELKFDVSLRGPKRDLRWSTEQPVLITAYGLSEQQCRLPIQLANNVISKVDHPADWRVVIACTPESWQKIALEYQNVGGTRVAFTTWDSPRVPGDGVVLTVLNAEQFDHCMRPGCYVHTILHELAHFRKVTSVEAVAESDAAEHEQALYREHPASEFPSILDLKARAFPLSVHLLEVQWADATGSGRGRGNVFIGNSPVAFDFTATCPDRLVPTAPAPAYKGKWEAEAKRLSVLVVRPAPQPPYTCELSTETRPGSVYQRNSATGAVSAITADQFNARFEALKAAARAKLTNADVVSMAGSGISTAVILAKIAASDCAFDTSPDALRQLQAAHVPEAVVLEMIRRSSQRTAVAQ